jgi:hypothetical protein
MWKVGLVLSTVVFFFNACMPKSNRESEVAYAVGSWWASPASNLLPAIKNGLPVVICFTSEGTPEPGELSRDLIRFDKIVRSALQEWISSLNSKLSFETTSASCRSDLARGHLQVTLHYNEQLFQTLIAQTTSPTLGVFLVGEGGLHLNVRGVLNPRRDPTGGYKTTLHELGHAFGLNHSNFSKAVMQPSLFNASAHLTSDDIASIKAVWAQLPSAQPKTEVRGADRANDNSRIFESPPEPQTQPTANWSAPQQRIPTERGNLAVIMRYDSWFKRSVAQSYTLADTDKCALQVNQKIVVQILDNGMLNASHLRVKLVEGLPGCAFGQIETIGFLYQPHID